VSAPRFLVDENLSVLLSEVAHPRGYEATHINHYGLRKSKGWGGTRGQDGTIRLLDLTDGGEHPLCPPFPEEDLASPDASFGFLRDHVGVWVKSKRNTQKG
jgi:hypothetical protein